MIFMICVLCCSISHVNDVNDNSEVGYIFGPPVIESASTWVAGAHTSSETSRPISSQSPVAPVVAEEQKPCLPLDLSSPQYEGLKVDSVIRDTMGSVMTLSCSHGLHFAEGGTTRTLVCRNGVWPATIPRCSGSFHYTNNLHSQLMQIQCNETLQW